MYQVLQEMHLGLFISTPLCHTRPEFEVLLLAPFPFKPLTFSNLGFLTFFILLTSNCEARLSSAQGSCWHSQAKAKVPVQALTQAPPPKSLRCSALQGTLVSLGPSPRICPHPLYGGVPPTCLTPLPPPKQPSLGWPGYLECDLERGARLLLLASSEGRAWRRVSVGFSQVQGRAETWWRV